MITPPYLNVYINRSACTRISFGSSGQERNNNNIPANITNFTKALAKFE
jgi:hypothetical protein